MVKKITKNKTLFNWGGGKQLMYKHYKPLIESIGPIETYCEPFLGGGAVFIELFTSAAPPKKAIINDRLNDLYRVYHAIKHNPDKFIQIYLDELETPFLSLDNKDDRKEFYIKKREYHAWTNFACETRYAAYTYFLLRTCFNGVYSTSAKYNNRISTAPGWVMKYHKADITAQLIKLWSDALSKSSLSNKDYMEVLSGVPDKESTLIFLDPPYRKNLVNYDSEFPDEEWNKIAEYLKGLKHAKFILCAKDEGDNFYQNNFGEFEVQSIDYAHRIYMTKGGTRKPVKELIITNIDT